MPLQVTLISLAALLVVGPAVLLLLLPGAR